MKICHCIIERIGATMPAKGGDPKQFVYNGQVVYPRTPDCGCGWGAICAVGPIQAPPPKLAVLRK